MLAVEKGPATLPMRAIAVFVSRPDRYTRSGVLVPIMTYIGNHPSNLTQAINLAKFHKKYTDKVWIGEGKPLTG